MYNVNTLKTINDDGTVPESRLNDAVEVTGLCNRLLNADEKRARTRAKVKGLFDGNPPYRDRDLTAAGQSYRCNTNWRIAESFLNVALTAYWDVVTEAPTMATCVTNYGDDEERVKSSKIITEEFQKFNLSDSCLNYMFQTSQHYMTLNGGGPVIWDDGFDYKARAVKNVLVPDDTPSNVDDWELAVVSMSYRVDELYSFIKNEKAATQAGWNVEAVKKSLTEAMPSSKWPDGTYDRWGYMQQRLRNNDLSVGMHCNNVQIAHVYYKEFPKGKEREGRISHCIVTLEKTNDEFLFRKVGRFANWRQAIAPFYYDVGDGTHHSVKGLGIKAFGALESVNRLQCGMVDSAHFGSAMHIQSLTEGMRQNAAVVEMGPYKVWPSGFTVIPNLNLGQQLDGPMAVKQDLINTVTSNLSQYRQGLSRQKGNPITATEATWRAENETTITRTQLTRYFDQLDEFYAERYRRVANPNTPYPECEEFQKRCKDRGVPAKALTDMCSVRATRTVGYGSAYNRLMSLNRLLQVLPMMPPEGQRNLIEDLTSSQVGHSLMRRYLPEEDGMFRNDHVIATLQVAAAKTGAPPVMPDDPNHEVFLNVFITAASQAAGSLEQGANPAEVYSFLEAIGPAIFAHIQKLEKQPGKKEAAKQYEEQAKEIAKVTDQLRDMLEQQAQQQAQAQQTAMQARAVSQGQDPDIQLKAAETKAKLDLQQVKTQHQMVLRQQKHQQDAAIKSAEAAQKMNQQQK